jgi:tRNA pseudouridine38-40 synthase
MAFLLDSDKKYKLQIAYDGTNYAGWQVQKTGIAIAPLIQKAIEIVLRHSIDLTGSGRTDAGVHALEQVAHFETKVKFDNHRFLLSINALLPIDIRVYSIEQVPNDFHSRYSATSKIYHYHLHLDPITDPFTRLYSYHVKVPCDLNLMKEAIPFFLGTHDYTSFANQPHRGTASYDPIRTIDRIDIVMQEGGVRLEFEAEGFLYKMVRNITGTLLDIGAKRMKAKQLPEIFASRDRKQAGTSAPPHGLFLMKVKYSRLNFN